MGTTTTRLSLYKPTIGERNYGALVNTNFDTLDDIDNKVDIREFLPSGFVTDGSVDYTTEIQAANDDLTNGGILIFPVGTWLYNLIISTGVYIEGQGPSATTFKPAIDDALIKTSLTTSTTNIGFKGFTIDGADNKATFTSQDGIRLKCTTTSTSIDSVIVDNVKILNCGQYGLHLYGDSTSGPFVQRLRLYNYTFRGSAKAGIYANGYVFETTSINGFIKNNGDASNPNIHFDFNGVSSGIRRWTFIGGAINNSLLPTTTNLIEMEHSRQVAFHGIDFESADKMIVTSGNQSENLTVRGCRFGTSTDVTTAIELGIIEGVDISNNIFECTPGTMTTAIKQASGLNTSHAKNIDIGKNKYKGNITTTVNIPNTRTIASGIIYAYQDFLVIDTEGAASTDNLDYIYDNSGTASTAWLQNGDLITIRAQNGAREIVLKHNVGNLMLKNSIDITLTDQHPTVTLKWDSTLSKWIEISSTNTASIQTLTGAGAVDIISSITHIVTTGADALTLADGVEGQRKWIVMKTDADVGTLTPSNLGNGTTITFDDVGDSADLLFTNGAWHMMGGTATLA